jgi:hypothetical protein
VLGGGGSAVTWTGREMVVWAGNSPDGPAGGAVYDPRANTWRRLPHGPLGVREGYVSAWTGSELLIFGGHTGAVATPTAAAVNPRTGTWRTLRALNAVTGLALANGAVWDGREAFVSGNVSDRRGRIVRAILLAFDPKSGALRRIDLGKAPLDSGQRARLSPIAWTGAEVVFSTGRDPSSSSLGVVRYNPATGRWKKASAAPCALPATGTQVTWIGNRLAAACGTDGLQIYTPRTDAWRAIKPGPSPLNSREGSAIAWTGTDLILWSGAANRRGNPTPADGASLGLGG